MIQYKHFSPCEVNCHRKVLEISKKGPGKSLKSPGMFCLEKWKNHESTCVNVINKTLGNEKGRI